MRSSPRLPHPPTPSSSFHTPSLSSPSGVGYATFIIILFAVLCDLICAVGTRIRGGLGIVAGSTVVFGLVVVILVTCPRGTDTDTREVDPTFSTSAGLIAVMSLGSALSLVAYCIYNMWFQVTAKPLSYRRDVYRATAD